MRLIVHGRDCRLTKIVRDEQGTWMTYVARGKDWRLTGTSDTPPTTCECGRPLMRRKDGSLERIVLDTDRPFIPA